MGKSLVAVSVTWVLFALILGMVLVATPASKSISGAVHSALQVSPLSYAGEGSKKVGTNEVPLQVHVAGTPDEYVQMKVNVGK